MKCPVCALEMVQENFGIEVQVCENGCKGLWFEHGELELLDRSDEGLGAALDAALNSPRKNDGQRAQLNCPKCSIPMHAHKFSRDKEVNVDECYACGGFFLDSGELKEIRDHFMSDAEVQTYTDQLLNAVPGYNEGLKNLDAEQQRNKAIQKFTKFLTISYWRKKA